MTSVSMTVGGKSYTLILFRLTANNCLYIVMLLSIIFVHTELNTMTPVSMTGRKNSTYCKVCTLTLVTKTVA